MAVQRTTHRSFVAKVATPASHGAAGEINVVVARVESPRDALTQYGATFSDAIMDIVSDLLVEIVREEEDECPET